VTPGATTAEGHKFAPEISAGDLVAIDA